MATVKYTFEVVGVDGIAKQFLDIALVARNTSPLRRAWLWCKHRPWLVFIAGIMVGQALVAIGRALAP